LADHFDEAGKIELEDFFQARSGGHFILELKTSAQPEAL
jgi:hypothetical protein